MSKLILHLGTNKTGTSYIQSWLKLNADNLKTKNYFIPQSLIYKNNNQAILPYCFGDPGDMLNRSISFKFSVMSNRDYYDFCQDTLDKFTNEIDFICKTIDNPTFIISSEQFSSFLQSPNNIQSLSEFLSNLFDDITIIMYIREPLSYMISCISQNLKVGSRINKLDRIPNASSEFSRSLCDHEQRCRLWETNFSHSQFKLRRFQGESFYKNDLIEDFLFSIGIENNDFKSVQRHRASNPSLSVSQMRYLYFLNKLYPPFKEYERNDARVGLISFIQKILNSKDQLLPTLAQVEDYESYYRESSIRLLSRYFPGDSTLWVSSYKTKLPSTPIILSQMSTLDSFRYSFIRIAWSMIVIIKKIQSNLFSIFSLK
ncbi:hypothetical protein SynMEDNS5_00205 [Synechococcus sp. MEDNS5]|uniref:hypothetical protein n=1 Tax=Synechococcus sp. MEDNS5 TaxID=1442554 RepID=UPI0016444302|nr:hypothetical protein [Synechococcus sp. MEDNS5]QNJ04966.1 hypothetical protein SynMEDNS5_00205 [Synechococcus sp. MEDNS5]